MQSPIRAILLLVFIAIPLLEIALLIKIGQVIGFWATILLVIATAVIGTWLLHAQGMETLRRVMTSMDEGKPPVTPVLEGFLLLIAGLLLLTPGILTDMVGFVLLVPPVRELLVRHAISKMFVVTVRKQGWSAQSGGGPQGHDQDWEDAEFEDVSRPTSPGPRSSSGQGPIIEGDYERLDERPIDPKRNKP